MRQSIFLLSLLLMISLVVFPDHPALATSSDPTPYDNQKYTEIHIMPYNKTGAVDVKSCAVAIQFISYDNGIDENMLAAVHTFIEASDYISEALEYPWGLEGERTICLKITGARKSSMAFEQIRDMLPARPARGLIVVNMGQKLFRVPE